MQATSPTPKQPPLAVPTLPGMTVVETRDGTSGTILGITQAYCLFRIEHTGSVVVAAWGDLALAHICPVRQLLPQDTTENDRCNASAVVLRDLLTLQQFGLTEVQQAAKNELLSELCGE